MNTTLSRTQLKDYISHIRELEVTCYELTGLHESLGQKLSRLQLDKNKDQAPEEYVKPDTLKDKIITLIGGVLLSVLAGAGIGLLIGIIISIVMIIAHLVQESSTGNFFATLGNIIWNIFNLGMSTMGPIFTTWIPRGIVVCAIIGFLFGCITTTSSWNTKKRVRLANREIKKKNTQLANYKSTLNTQMTIVKNNINQTVQKYQETQNALNKLYNLNIIFPKYRNIVAVSMFEEYLVSGRCTSLEGHEGAYNIYENEIRMNVIISKLDDIVTRLDEISSNQYIIYQELKESQKKTAHMMSSIDASMQRLNESQEVSAYYNRIAAKNTDTLVWMEIFDK